MTKHIEISMTDQFFINADELENTLHKVGQRVTNGQYNKPHNLIMSDNGRKLGECRVLSNPMTLVQCLKAGHDSNGNRRAIYLQYDLNGDVIAVYKYNNKIPSALQTSSCIIMPDIEVSYKTIKDWINGAKNHPLVNFYEGE